MNDETKALTQEDLDQHPELAAAGLKVGDMPIPADQLQEYTVTEFDSPYLSLGLKVGDVIMVRKPEVVAKPEPKIETYRAVLDAVYISGKTLLKGETVDADSDDSVVQGMVAAGAIVLVETVAPSAGLSPVPESSDTAAVAMSDEPRKRYRGVVVVAESVRTVEGRGFNHIKLADGVEMDLNQLEYETEVKVSYPPNN